MNEIIKLIIIVMGAVTAIIGGLKLTAGRKPLKLCEREFCSIKEKIEKNETDIKEIRKKSDEYENLLIKTETELKQTTRELREIKEDFKKIYEHIMLIIGKS